MRSFASIVIVSGIFTTTPLLAAEQPKFETASVKRAKECVFQNTIDPGIVAFHGYPLIVVLREAFTVKMDQIVGPSWLSSDTCFTIDAKIPQGANKDQIPAMLQALLAERFKLAAHKESKVRAGYALVVDKNGPKFRQSEPNSASTMPHAGQIMFGVGPGASQIKGSITTASLAHFVSGRLNAPVEDLTGLKGKYDIDVLWVPDRSIEKMGPYAAYAAAHSDSTDNAAPPTIGTNDIFSSFRNTLGLRLEPRKEPVEELVIDHIERIPTEN